MARELLRLIASIGDFGTVLVTIKHGRVDGFEAMASTKWQAREAA